MAPAPVGESLSSELEALATAAALRRRAQMTRTNRPPKRSKE
jgi:hypothetical protein